MILATGPAWAYADGGAPLRDGRTGPPRERQRQEQQDRGQDTGEVKAFLETLLRSENAEEARRADRERQIQKMMQHLQQLRIRQVDLQAVHEHAAMEQDHDKVQAIRRELIELEHELRRGELDLQGLIMERDRDAERRDLLRMTDRLEYVASWRDVAFDSPQAIMMATQAVVELHLAGGDVPGAAQKLEDLLHRIDSQGDLGIGTRTAIRFALKDLYTELEQYDRAAEQMLQVILENAPLRK